MILTVIAGWETTGNQSIMGTPGDLAYLANHLMMNRDNLSHRFNRVMKLPRYSCMDNRTSMSRRNGEEVT